jgi:uncharacterized sporulation protein YeaH/YhbH (DUF444 family)
MIHQDYAPEAWNLYAFHFSDGENFGSEDDERCVKLLEEELLPVLNLFCYGQVRSYYGKQFIDNLTKIEDEKLTTAKIKDDDDIYAAIKTFLGKGY